MSMFVARHQHSADHCPAKDPVAGQMLLKQLDPASAKASGVTIYSEAVIDGQHTLYLIAEANDRTQLEQYLKPFAMAGTVEVRPASHCAAILDRGGCDATQL